MSFAITKPQFLARSKSVTRRLGWKDLQAGALVQAVEKAMGLKKGERVRVLGTIRVLDVRTETLDRMTQQPSYGLDEVIAEGFPELDPAEFVQMFCDANKCLPTQPVQRIEFEYVLINCWRCQGLEHSIDAGATCARCLMVGGL